MGDLYYTRLPPAVQLCQALGALRATTGRSTTAVQGRLRAGTSGESASKARAWALYTEIEALYKAHFIAVQALYKDFFIVVKALYKALQIAVQGIVKDLLIGVYTLFQDPSFVSQALVPALKDTTSSTSIPTKESELFSCPSATSSPRCLTTIATACLHGMGKRGAGEGTARKLRGMSEDVNAQTAGT